MADTLGILLKGAQCVKVVCKRLRFPCTKRETWSLWENQALLKQLLAVPQFLVCCMYIVLGNKK